MAETTLTYQELTALIEGKYRALEDENKLLKQERDEWKEKALTYSVGNNINEEEKRAAWDEIYDCLIADPDRIKTIMKSNIIGINEKDGNGQTLLMLSADYGLFMQMYIVFLSISSNYTYPFSIQDGHH